MQMPSSLTPWFTTDQLMAVHPQDDAAQAFWLPISEVHAQGHRFFDDHQDMIVHLTQRT